jgi:uncharacterized protein
MKPEDYLKNAKAYFWKESFAIVKAKHIHPGAFTNIVDKDEITVIIDQTKLKSHYQSTSENQDSLKINKQNYSDFDKQNLAETEKDWKILTLDVVFPLDTVGILAKISGVLAERGISIMTISAYSRDHFLIREKDMEIAIIALESVGISFH